jgi:hypothetical protein
MKGKLTTATAPSACPRWRSTTAASPLEPSASSPSPWRVAHCPVQAWAIRAWRSWTSMGDGLPGLLQTGPGGFRFWRNLGQGVLERPPNARPDARRPVPGSTRGRLCRSGRQWSSGPTGSLRCPARGSTKRHPEGRMEALHPLCPSTRVPARGSPCAHAGCDGRWPIRRPDDHRQPVPVVRVSGRRRFRVRPRAVARIHDLDQFPDLDFNDPAGRVRLADMSGDGLNDIVLIHDGRIDYWPQPGLRPFRQAGEHGHGPPIRCRFRPPAAHAGRPERNRAAPTWCMWIPAGCNSGSTSRATPGAPARPSWAHPGVDDSSAVEFADLLGTGTATLVWSGNPGDTEGSHYKALDFCGGVKPYVLQGTDNPPGHHHPPALRPFHPASSWKTGPGAAPGSRRCPFPFRCCKRWRPSTTSVATSTSAPIATTMVTTTAGSARSWASGGVDQFDSETFADFARPDLHGDDSPFGNASPAHHMPPVETRTWYHTGGVLRQPGCPAPGLPGSGPALPAGVLCPRHPGAAPAPPYGGNRRRAGGSLPRPARRPAAQRDLCP